MLKFHFVLGAAALALVASSAGAGSTISNDLSKCGAGDGPSVLVTVRNIKSATGKIRLQSYQGTKESWLKKGAWLNRIETRATGSTMQFCMPVPSAGNYGIAIRHDANGNNESDITQDGGGVSNNPSINIFNLGKPSVKKSAFYAGRGVTKITIEMKYM